MTDKESLEQEKLKLEIRKLQTEINDEKNFSSKRIWYAQIWLPSIIGIIPLFITAIFLASTNIFEVNSKLLEIKKDTLSKAVKLLQDSNASLIINGKLLRLEKDSLIGVITRINEGNKIAGQSQNEREKIITKLLNDTAELNRKLILANAAIGQKIYLEAILNKRIGTLEEMYNGSKNYTYLIGEIIDGLRKNKEMPDSVIGKINQVYLYNSEIKNILK